MYRNKRGFTLIELLVVIAIIGVLSTVVIGAVNSARNRGADAAVASNLSNSRVSAEIYNDSVGGYAGVLAGAPANICTAGTTGIHSHVLAALRVTIPAALATAVANAAPATATFATGARTAYCYSNAATWAAAAPIRSTNAAGFQYHCVDSSGASRISAGVTLNANGALTCN